MKNVRFLLFVWSIVVVGCNNNSNDVLIDKTTVGRMDSANKKATDTIWLTPDTIAVFRNEYKGFDTMIRYRSEVPVNVVAVGQYKGKLADPDLKSYKYGKKFKTRITETVNREGINFAGQYCFVRWGCGSPCWMSCVVDMKTGRIYEGPEGCNGYVYDRNSSLLVVNPPTDGDWYNKERVCGAPEEYVWDGKYFN